MKKTRSLLFLVGLVTSLLFSPAIGQTDDDTGASEPAQTESAVPDDSKTFVETLAAGGWAMYPLGALSVAMVTLTIFNFIALREKNFIQGDTVHELQGHLESGDIAGAIRIC